MDANTRKLERIFDQTITYQVPLFQRPYVWTKEANWEPLWEDIQALLDKHLRGGKVHPHFLGAVVLEQLGNSTGSIESRQIIDGQQRFTTLQLFLLAARDLATARGSTKYVERFTDLVANRRSKIDHDDEVFKVWPTNSNRAAYRVVHEAGSPENLANVVLNRPEMSDRENSIIGGYQYFHAQLLSWVDGALDNDEDAELLATKATEDRFDSIWSAIKDGLQVVVIDLDANDETQVIFETLNATGQELLPADLIKNFLFRRAAADDGAVEKLYEDHWQQFETNWWRAKVKQGRISRQRIDAFINYYLTMMNRDEVKTSHLFNAFKTFVDQSTLLPNTPIVIPKTAAQHIAQLARYASVFKTLNEPAKHPRLAAFLRRLEAVDTTTVFPFLLFAHAELVPKNIVEFDKILHVIESFLMRRMICDLTGKNYNRFFVDLLRAVDKCGSLSATLVAEYMSKGTGDSSRYPDSASFTLAVTELPLYGRLAQYKVRTVLEALDAYAYTPKSEVLPLPETLTIEHVLPQKWQEFWPLAAADKIHPETNAHDPIKEQKATQRRDRLTNTLGNLTLITGSLNPALSNSAWAIKRPEILKFSKLNLTQYFHGKDADVWDEAAIERRTAYLCKQLEKIWPPIGVLTMVN